MLTEVVAEMNRNGVDAVFISQIYNVRYISKYTSTDAYLLITTNKNYFITDKRFTEQAQNECPGYIVVDWKSVGKSIGDAVKNLSNKNGIKRLGFEKSSISYMMYSSLKEGNNAELVPLSNFVEKYRMIKKPYEVECLKTACEISCRAFDRIIKDIKVGVTEKEIAAKLSYYMVNEGSDTQPYGGIVISGKRTSLLHGIPSDKTVEDGDFVLLDYGCAYKGYLSDMTRTVVVGKASVEQKKVYEREKRMIYDSLAVMKSGTTGKEVYEASISAIKDTEYFKYHYNGIGHGIGLFLHENPFLGPNSDFILAENVVTTIEPGLYIPDWGGVRIEDQILITNDGYINFVTATKDLIEL